MNLFKKLFGAKPKDSSPKKPKPIPEWWRAKWDKIAVEYPVGRKFEYMGRTLIVESHGWDYDGIRYTPHICTAYADDKGHFHEWWFYPKNFALLPTDSPTP